MRSLTGIRPSGVILSVPWPSVGDERTISWEPRIYEASLETSLDILASTSAKPGRVLLIGHNPGLEHLVRYLSDDSLDA